MRKFSLCAFILFLATVAKSNTIEVQNNNDSSTGSLRQSIIDANDGDTIRFNPNLIANGSNTITLTSEIAFSKLLVFKGLYNSSDTLFISGNNTNRIFNITNTATVTLDSMVFVNGNPGTDGGGGLLIAGVQQVLISNSVINNCSASSTGGGLRFSTNSTNNGPSSQILLEMSNSKISNNLSSSFGGGVYIGGSNITLIINDCDINNNSATSGGGIYGFAFDDGTVTIENSIFSSNNATSANGGGLFAWSYSNGVYTTINNSTFDNNIASGTAGAIYSTSNNVSSVTVNNSTISNNTADIAGGIFSGEPSTPNSESIVSLSTTTLVNNHATTDVGGVYSVGNSAEFTATNSTIYDNSVATAWNKVGGIQVFGTAFGLATSTINTTSSIISTSVGDNIKHLIVDNGGNIIPASNTLNSGGYNIFSDAPSGSTGTGDLTNVSDIALDLQTLANNGGTILTRMPGSSSVAINAGNLNDLSDAQNGAITGIRDVGASERINTITLVNSITVQGQGGVSTITSQGGTLQMEAIVLPTNADDMTYTWSVTNGTGSASIDANGLLTAITDGTVDVIATANDASGTTGSATITISNQSVGLSEIVTKDISVYPNPVANELFIDVAEGQIHQIEIIDHSGRIMKTVSSKQVNSIDVSNLTQGVYVLKVVTENGISANQFIKNK